MRRIIGEVDIKSEVHFTGLVLEDDLPYSGADLLFAPSYYEGVDLPALEAMTCRTPVVASRCKCALPELVADAVVLVDPYDLEALSPAIQLVLDDETLRFKLISKGLELARLFSWQKTAELNLQILEDAVSSN